MRETSKLNPAAQDREVERNVRTVEVEVFILNAVENKDGIVIRRLASRLNISKDCVHCMVYAARTKFETVTLPTSPKSSSSRRT